ncbi:hypothetical protein M758_3G103200 [Ceratodon purpureus]|nr:hypothetical protein M758_3G103200 [Ceratodon purpureus]
MQSMQLGRHVPTTELCRRGSPGLGTGSALAGAYLRRSALSGCPDKSSRLCLAGTGVDNQAQCGARLVAGGRSERPRVVALAQMRTLELDPVPLDEGMPKWQGWLAFATSLYPVYMVIGGIIAFWKPSAFAWFVKRGPDSYSAALGVIMLAMGFTLEIKDLIHVLTKRPAAVMFGFAAQYTIMPLLGAALSRGLGLPAELSAGLILMACCPGGTASNVVTYIARGDVPLSILMTICTTFAAVFTTPLLTSILAGAYVPVDAVSMALSTLQVVLAPVIVGACLQTFFPRIAATITHFAPLIAVLVSSLLASSVFSANVPLLVASNAKIVTSLENIASIAPITNAPPVMVNLGIIGGAVLALHGFGFLLG